MFVSKQVISVYNSDDVCAIFAVVYRFKHYSRVKLNVLILPGDEMKLVSAVIYPITPTFTPSTSNTLLALKSPCNLGSLLTSMLALRTGTVRFLK